jgi:hypothetical protein
MASNHVFDAAKAKRATRTILDENGNPVVERRPIQKSALALNPAGHVVWFPFYTGPAQTAQDDPYKTRVTFEKSRWGTGKSKKPGFLFLDSCPQTQYGGPQNLPESRRGRAPCRVGAKGGPISAQDPCECILEAKLARQARTNAETAESTRTLKSVAERTTEAHNEAVAAAEKAAQAAMTIANVAAEKARK